MTRFPKRRSVMINQNTWHELRRTFSLDIPPTCVLSAKPSPAQINPRKRTKSKQIPLFNHPFLQRRHSYPTTPATAEHSSTASGVNANDFEGTLEEKRKEEEKGFRFGGFGVRGRIFDELMNFNYPNQSEISVDHLKTSTLSSTREKDSEKKRTPIEVVFGKEVNQQVGGKSGETKRPNQTGLLPQLFSGEGQIAIDLRPRPKLDSAEYHQHPLGIKEDVDLEEIENIPRRRRSKGGDFEDDVMIQLQKFAEEAGEQIMSESDEEEEWGEELEAQAKTEEERQWVLAQREKSKTLKRARREAIREILKLKSEANFEVEQSVKFDDEIDVKEFSPEEPRSPQFSTNSTKRTEHKEIRLKSCLKGSDRFYTYQYTKAYFDVVDEDGVSSDERDFRERMNTK